MDPAPAPAADPVAAAPVAAAVALKLPTFWPSQARVWFTQTEAQFHLRNIVADETKYFHVVSALDEQSASRLLSFLAHPPAQAKYDALKTRLLTAFTLTESERSARLLSMNGLGDRKPSQLMDEMLALLDQHAPCFLFKHLFLQQLPEDVRLSLATSDFADPRAFAQVADRLWLSKQGSDTLSALRRPRKQKPDSPRMPASPPDTLCWYHRRFGSNARKCVLPCTSSASGNATTDRQ